MGWAGDIINSATKAVKWIGPAALAPLTGGASLGAYAAYGANSANKANKAMAQKQMDFQERMSNTEWQRGTADMLAAGINPMLATARGGASSPAGSTAQMENVAGPAINSALAVQQAKANIELTKANTAKTIEEAKTSAATAARAPEMAHYQVEKIRKDVEKVIADFQLTHQQEEQIKRMLPALIAQAEAQTRLADAQTNSAKTAQQLAEYGLPEAKANAALWDTVEGWGKGASATADITSKITSVILNILRGRK